MIRKINKEELLVSVNRLPVLSNVVSKAIKLIEDPNCSIRELSDIISKDQSISVKVVRLANSAFYGTPRKMTSLHEALIRLGLKTSRSLLITASMSNLFRKMADGFIITKSQLWTHSYAVAFISGSIAKATKRVDNDIAFTAGIIHDIGKLILANHLKNSYQDIVKLSIDSNVELWTVEDQKLGLNHATIGGLVLDHWNFPETIVTAVSNHHSLTCESEFDSLTGVLTLADGLAIEKGIGISSVGIPHELIGYIQEIISLSDEKRTRITDLLMDELASLGELFHEDKEGVPLALMTDSFGKTG